MHARTVPQNKLFHALVRDVVTALPLVPWKRALAAEAWKRYFIAIWVREARMEAYANGGADPFPVRPVPSSTLKAWQVDELIECTLAYCAMHLGLVLEDKPAAPLRPAQQGECNGN